MGIAALAPLCFAHAGHGQGGDSPHPALRALHYLQEPRHALPAALAGALVSVLAIRWLRRHVDRERE
jgi:hypothetical protein